MLARLQRGLLAIFEWLYGLYVLFWFVSLALVCLGIIAWPLRIETRRAIAHELSRFFMFLLGTRLQVIGSDHLPSGPCMVVANHASYLDGIVLKAALPARFSFIIKKEVGAVPIGGQLLRRVGSEFIDRTNRQAAASDTRRLLKAAGAGQALVFFPEGTFDEAPGLRKFHSGAFVIASHAGFPVVPVALQGTRHMFPHGRLLPRPGRVRVLIQPCIEHQPGAAQATRDEARARILCVLGEPDLAAHSTVASKEAAEQALA
jgi:1-acyl-sn-glycerol-3-phosphate acyltransferase